MRKIREFAKIATRKRDFKLLQLHRTWKLFVLKWGWDWAGAGNKRMTHTVSRQFQSHSSLVAIYLFLLSKYQNKVQTLENSEYNSIYVINTFIFFTKNVNKCCFLICEGIDPEEFILFNEKNI